MDKLPKLLQEALVCLRKVAQPYVRGFRRVVEVHLREGRPVFRSRYDRTGKVVEATLDLEIHRPGARDAVICNVGLDRRKSKCVVVSAEVLLDSSTTGVVSGEGGLQEVRKRTERVYTDTAITTA